MKLVLSDGNTFVGRQFGASANVEGEVVFCTGHSGYVETLTDPSYRGQILVLTYPLQGNYGVPNGPFESDRIQIAGLVVQRHARLHSHHSATQTLGHWLESENVPAIEHVDTRTLTRKLREHGTMKGVLRCSDGAETRATDMTAVARLVAPTKILHHAGGRPRILVIDTGGKDSLVRSLLRRGASVVRAPFTADWEPLLGEVDGVFLTNGPGDPMDLMPLVERLRRSLLENNIPTFGVCLGHQLLCLAGGARTYKLPYGHRSHNQPVRDLTTGRAYVTSQNHGYAVDTTSLPPDWCAWFTNLNDGTNEGVFHRNAPFFSVQFHPEGAAGPRDTSYLFDDFLRRVREGIKGSHAT